MATIPNQPLDLSDWYRFATSPRLRGSNPLNTSITRSVAGTSVPGFAGVFMLERAITRATSTGVEVDVWHGRFKGNSGDATVTWQIVDGSRTAVNAVSGYNALSKTISFSDGEYGWKKITVPLQTWVQTDDDHVVLEITNVTINEASPDPFYSAKNNKCLIRIIDNSVINNSRLWLDKDHPSASDTNPGTQTQPFLTANKLFDEMNTQQKKGYVVAASTPYEELRRVGQSDWSGFSFERTVGGANFSELLTLTGLNSSGQRITTPFDGTAPVFDNNYQQGSQAAHPACAMYIHSGAFLLFEDLELRNCQQGFLVNPSGTNINHIYAERIWSHGHIGGDNRAGFRWDNVSDSVIHNCKINNIYDNRNTNVSNPHNDTYLTSGTYNGQAVYSGHNGVQSFGADRMVVEYCDIEWVGRGIYGKEQRNVNGPLEQSMWVKNNQIRWAGIAAYECANQGARPGAKDVGMMFNTVYKAQYLILIKDGNASGGQADGAFVFNNSTDQVDNLYHFHGITGVRTADNLLANFNSHFTGSKKVINYGVPENPTWSTFVDFAKSNSIPAAANNFWLDQYGGNPTQKTTLAGWQSIYTDNPTPAASYMSENPEQFSDTNDPGFIDTANGDFTRAGNPMDSMFGPSPRGALIDQYTVVGCY